MSVDCQILAAHIQNGKIVERRGEERARTESREERGKERTKRWEQTPRNERGERWEQTGWKEERERRELPR